MNRSAILSLLLLALLLLSGCRQSHQSSCLIMGTMENHTLDGKTIYLVPLVGPHDAAHVDSTTIENARFQFEVDSTEVKVIRVGYRYREGIEDMLVVSEPGTVNVHIGKLSSCGGTPQNDSLQAWKDSMERYRMLLYQLQTAKRKTNDKDAVQARLEQLYDRQQRYIADFTKRQPEGALKDVLMKLYPQPNNK